MWSSDLKSDNLKLRWLIAITLLVNAAALLNPLIVEGDSVTYAALAQHMAVHNNWADLMLDGRSWLDKPHFPFWVTALSFELLGPSSFAYSLPGFLFHLMGGYFTYRIARLLFDRNTALLALLVFLSAYHVMYTSSAVKAEAFLTGTITGACYYWLRFDADAKWKYLVLGAAFSAMSVMTKGVFTLITITSGLVCMWLYLGQWRKLWSAKWLLAAVLTCLFMAPELMALYLQFDVNPQKKPVGARPGFWYPFLSMGQPVGPVFQIRCPQHRGK
jgi:4-amino-4-deoxy-L-arabinose transferase-like glycosyltransferase